MPDLDPGLTTDLSETAGAFSRSGEFFFAVLLDSVCYSLHGALVAVRLVALNGHEVMFVCASIRIVFL